MFCCSNCYPRKLTKNMNSASKQSPEMPPNPNVFRRVIGTISSIGNLAHKEAITDIPRQAAVAVESAANQFAGMGLEALERTLIDTPQEVETWGREKIISFVHMFIETANTAEGNGKYGKIKPRESDEECVAFFGKLRTMVVMNAIYRKNSKN